MEKRHSETEMLIPMSSDDGGNSGNESDSEEDVITDYQLLDGVPNNDLQPSVGNGVLSAQRENTHPLPTISLTSYSPTTTMRTYSMVLEDSLQQVHELRESVQMMRNSTNIPNFTSTRSDYGPPVFNLATLGQANTRVSSSCPTLNEGTQDSDVITWSVGSSPVTQSLSRKDSQAGQAGHQWLGQGEMQRRKSWSGFEELVKTTLRQHHRQRSISLGSMESMTDEPSIDDISNSTQLREPAGVDRRRNRGNAHSLNETDFQDFNKIKQAKREAEQLLAQRPLQKSVSTPSIVPFVCDMALKPSLDEGHRPVMHMGRPGSMERGIEEGGRRSSHTDYEIRIKDHPEKLRKRGSLFFRKKKDKNKKFPHQWVSASYGSSQICDVCTKPLSGKPALYCEPCATTVHQNACKDTISECVSNKLKNAKSMSKLTGFSVPLAAVRHHQSSKKGSNSHVGGQNTYTDEKDGDSQHENFNDEASLVQFEFSAGTAITASDLCPDLNLGLYENEPDSWSSYVGKDVSKKLKQKEVKRQEHIYEFILTEKHHCMTLLVMQKIFVEGLQKHFNMGQHMLERMFPRLLDLTELHLGFLAKLRQRQRENLIIDSIADILLEEFSGNHSSKLKSAYGEFCSRHRDAVDTYRECLQSDPQIGLFVRHCQSNPLLKKKGIPECILFVTQRLTKYPLLIEPLIKTGKDNVLEVEALQKALALVKDILVEVNSQVAEKEKEDRKLDIYHRIDSKSSTLYRGMKFKKSDILQGNRSLKFEGEVLMQSRNKMHVVVVVVMSDVLFFLQETGQKYSFFTPDDKPGVVSLQKLLVRDKAGQDSRSIFLISTNPAAMFDVKVHKPKDKHIWIQAIREAVQKCPECDDDPTNVTLEDQQNQLRSLVTLLRQNDLEQAILLEEKMALQLKLLSASGLEPPSPPSYRHLVNENLDPAQMWQEVFTAVQEVNKLVSSLYATGTNLSRSVSSAGERQSDAYVSPILPKRAETFSGFDNNAPANKIPGKKLHTAASNCQHGLKTGDIKQLLEKLPFRNHDVAGSRLITHQEDVVVDCHKLQQSAPSSSHNHQPSMGATNPSIGVSCSSLSHVGVVTDNPALLTVGREQQYAAVQVGHYVYTLLCIISQLITTNGSLQTQIATIRPGQPDKHYRHNQQLEELRNLQDKLREEKATWATVKERESKEIEDKKQELLKLQDQIREEQKDITKQREQLYRKMEILTSQGLLISPNVAIPISSGQVEENFRDCQKESKGSPLTTHHTDSPLTGSTSLSHSGSTVGHTGSTERRKWGKTSNQPKHPPLHLISSKNQQKVQQIPVKQQIPFKLATRLSSGGAAEGSPRGHPATSGGPQQLLPLKLSQDEDTHPSGGRLRP